MFRDNLEVKIFIKKKSKRNSQQKRKKKKRYVVSRPKRPYVFKGIKRYSVKLMLLRVYGSIVLDAFKRRMEVQYQTPLRVFGNSDSKIMIFQRYIIEISSIGGPRHNIQEINIGTSSIFRYLSAFYQFFADNLQYVGVVNAVYVVKLCWGLNHNETVYLVLSQPLGQVCPLLYKLHQIYINSNSSYKHNF